MKVADLKEYELLEERNIADLNSVSYLLRHKKSGARISVISNDDENKVFYIGFRTPPKDSTGLPHILEHSVLCGSKKFPAKDPFVELVKGSLNTFLNAMTYPDKTVYPIASCNDKDFQNLMDVYMDSVLNPNIYIREEIFKQEGWHYELESKDDKLKYNGVVYNEMKGAFSSPEGVLEREILNSLFPDNEYSNESGGNPKDIPTLSYEEFLKFHKTYYHPVNSYIYLYGDMDVAEKLIWLDKEYLCKYDRIEIDSAIREQKPFDKPVEIVKKYSITEDESMEENTYLSYNMVVGTSLDKKLYQAFQIIEYALLTAPGAKLKQALLDAKLGKDIMGSYDTGMYQPIFSIIAKNSDTDKKEKFIKVIRETLEDAVKNKIDKKALKAGINYYEFRYREADFGSLPKGLMYGLEMLESWLYDDEKPYIHIEALDTFKFLKEQVETDYFEKLIEEYLLNNNHVSVVIIEPEKELTKKQDEELEKKLSQYKESLSDEEIDRLINDTKALRKYQEEPSTKEELESIPMLTRNDMKKTPSPLYIEEKEAEGIKVIHHNLFTNGIGYLNILFNTQNIPNEYIPYIGILKSVLGLVDTKNYSYADLFNEININTGGISNGISVIPDMTDTQKFMGAFQIKAKALYENFDFMMKMIKEIIVNTKLDDDKRLYEIIAQLKSRLQMGYNSSGHLAAVMRANSYYSRASYYNEMVSGISFYKIIEDIEASFEEKKEELKQRLKETMQMIFREENIIISITADEKGYALFEKEVSVLKESLYTNEVKKGSFEAKLVRKNEGFKTSSQVQYVARCGNFKEKGYEYTGALRLLKVMLGYDYLWNNIRVQGGAYGCMGNFSMTGDSYVVSYRDPHLKRTMDIYNKIPEFLESFDADEREMTKYIIGTISDMDTPMNPYAKGSRSMTAYLSNIDMQMLQKERDEVLSAMPEDIRKLADTVRAMLKDNNICVIGNAQKIDEAKDLFDKCENLFK